MTNQVKQSLEENKDYILSCLHAFYHQNFIDSIETAEPTKVLCKEEAILEAEYHLSKIECLCDEERQEILSQIKKDSKLAKPIEQPCAEELEKQKKEWLNNAYHHPSLFY